MLPVPMMIIAPSWPACAPMHAARVACKDHVEEGMGHGLRRRDVGGVADARQRQTCKAVMVMALTGLLKTAVGRGDNRGKALLEPKADIGRTGHAFAENRALGVGDAGAALCAAAVASKKKYIRLQ
jgi:hypothetical protein